MSKIKSNKYFTPIDIAKYCIDKTYEVIGEENITEIIESSAGNGSFSSQIDNCIAYDIEPEGNSIIKQDFLELQIEYKKGRLIGFNPPFGDGNVLARRFYNKAVEIADYISFILPITQLNNNQSLYKFNLIYSEDLGVLNYSDVNVHCCLNIYSRNSDGSLSIKTDYSLKDMEVREYGRRDKKKSCNPLDADFGICTWGKGSCGKIPNYPGQYAQEHYFFINNRNLLDKILDVCYNTNWNKDVAPNNTSSKKIETWRIYKYLKEQITELK